MEQEELSFLILQDTTVSSCSLFKTKDRGLFIKIFNLTLMKMYPLLLFVILSLGCEQAEENVFPNVSPELSITGVSVEEGNVKSPLYLQVILSNTTDKIVTAEVTTSAGTATAHEDFIPITRETISFEPGSVLKELKVEVLGDEQFEPDESFFIRIENIEGARGGEVEATIVLLNDDPNDVEIFIPETGYSTPESYPGMQLVWQDEFSGEELNTAFWTYEIGTGNNGWGNNESQYYRPDNTSIYKDNLVIEAREEVFGGNQYTSSRIITRDGFDFQYGRVDIRAALPYGQGIWPALWMLGSAFTDVGWPACGEIDIMEIVGHEPNTLHGTAHWSSSGQHTSHSGSTTPDSGTLQDKYHVYSILWDETQIQWLLDDEVYHTLNITSPEHTEFHGKFFFIFNVAVGGNWPGYPDNTTVFPQRMVVDYIRVFQED